MLVGSFQWIKNETMSLNEEGISKYRWVKCDLLENGFLKIRNDAAELMCDCRNKPIRMVASRVSSKKERSSKDMPGKALIDNGALNA